MTKYYQTWHRTKSGGLFMLKESKIVNLFDLPKDKILLENFKKVEQEAVHFVTE